MTRLMAASKGSTGLLLAGGTLAAVVGTLGLTLLAGLTAMQTARGGCLLPPTGNSSHPASTPAAASAPARAPGDLSRTQLAHAATIWATGHTMGIPTRGIVIALATASQESDFLVYANRNVPASLALPHDAVGHNYDSLGLFQQRPSAGWGTPRQLMDPATSARIFYQALRDVAGWQQMPLTQAAQAVQRSAFPLAYADDAPLARRLVAHFAHTQPTSDATIIPASSSGNCVLAAGSGALVVSGVAFPLPRDSGYVNQRNFGRSGAMWSSGHTGTDLSVACGTPVYAAHGGVVRIDRDAPWAGPWLVKIATGEHSLTTWYAHMSAITVHDGQRVAAGQQIGAVGSLGNSTGCHLHFEVHPHGGSIYQDLTNPTEWLSQHLNLTGAA